jgi:hypothetical protein
MMTGTIVARTAEATGPDDGAPVAIPLPSGTGQGAAPVANRWRTSIVVFGLTAVLSAAIVIATLAALDPYDTGRFALMPLWHGHVDPDKQSRGRDPQFDSAIIGNSRIEMLRPAQLDEQTGMRFVSLYYRGAEPIEELTILHYFLRYHPAPRAIVVGLEETWCFDPLQSDLKTEFPSWLYEANTVSYLAHLYRFSSVENWLAYNTPVKYRADGFNDYEPMFHAAGADAMEIVRKKFSPFRPTVPYTSDDAFPAAAELEKVMRDLPATTAVVLAWVPLHISVVPVPGSPAEQAIAACHAAYVFDGSVHPRTRIVNWSVDRPENRIDENYFDKVHYRSALATAFGRDIIEQLNAASSDR